MTELSAPIHAIQAKLHLSGSKSLSNRLLILNEIFKSDAVLTNSSDSEDTLLLEKALAQLKNNTSGVIDINHAGTDMRFLTALLSVTEGVWTLTGSERIKQRPVGELVTALRALGAEITYLEKENFAPLKISGKKINGGRVEADASISSQFISALLLIAPTFKNGLTLILKNNVVSRPYIDMTIALLKQFGVSITETAASIQVHPSSIPPHPSSTLHLPFSIFPFPSSIESDWSSASYWYAICALSPQADIELSNFNISSLQADAVLPKLYDALGVHTVFKNGSIFLSKKNVSATVFNHDFTNCPDIAQTLAVTCVGLGIEATLTGLATLKIKETDRIAALKTELEKTGVAVTTTGHSVHIRAGRNHMPTTPVTVATYHDHRMAMSFAPLALVYPSICIENPGVVTKSYPRFWEDLKYVGFNVNLRP